ncbi:hypothetical protein SLH46_06215 [Draconibacterium sp. IB214405]|uniref:hypothetical protein n=1 Tax=Draconibacterium sp. IB214405 TaxID=3097352 RepID=UPI002A15DC0E|nr:hypothetical protein [Draconibacterium sp. IB214405]MDX8338766.1 hypothetical protein [Draconibacterium sp. IB214405]
MLNHDWYFEISEFRKEIKALKESVDIVKSIVKPEEELWDNFDMERNWGVSPRLLSDWRKNGLIAYVQIGNKIWYPREARELILLKHYKKPKNGGHAENESN